MTFDAADPTSSKFRRAIASQFDHFLVDVESLLTHLNPKLVKLAKLANTYLQGGKRLRPAFSYWGYAAFAPQPADAAALLRACAGFEMLHVGILVHDDVLDDADSRRGLLSAHQAFAKYHRDHQGIGSADDFGRSAAVVLGDLMISWANQMVYGARLDPRHSSRALAFWQAVQTEVNAGQYLDIANQYALLSNLSALDAAQLVLEVKTARYTVIRPLQFGAACAGADDHALAKLAEFGSPIGQAFQLRDDLLGVFASADETGKPAGGDLVEAKRTVLLEAALALSNQSDRLLELIGHRLTDDQLQQARQIISESGAVAEVENQIAQCLRQAQEILESLELRADGATALTSLAKQSINRSF